MDLTLIINDNCDTCTRVEKILRKLINGQKEIILSVINIKNTTSLKTQICPALFVNQELYSYGDINEEKFSAFLKKQYKEGAFSRAVYKSN